MENILETKSLSYSYGKEKVLDNVNIQVPRGSIYCFLGSNGAGKTTAIKIMLSLLQIEANKIYLFGKDLTSNRIEVLRKVGAIIENPSLYGHLSGRENLLLYSKMLGVDKKRIDEVMEITRIGYAAKKRVKHYSLGMKQRLEIARSLLTDPELLILDEPTNGLDPQGIKEIREFIIGLNKELGKTIFLSSHLLDEVQRMATHVGIINGGRLLFQGELEDLNNTDKHIFTIQTSDNTLAAQIIQKEGIDIISANGCVDISSTSKTDIASVNKLLVKNSIDVYELKKEKTELEKIFFSITNH